MVARRTEISESNTFLAGRLLVDRSQTRQVLVLPGKTTRDTGVWLEMPLQRADRLAGQLQDAVALELDELAGTVTVWSELSCLGVLLRVGRADVHQATLDTLEAVELTIAVGDGKHARIRKQDVRFQRRLRMRQAAS